MAQTPSQGRLDRRGWGPQLPLEIELFVLGCSAQLPGSSCKQPSGLGESQNGKGMCAEQVEGLGRPGKGCERPAGLTVPWLRQEGAREVGAQGLGREAQPDEGSGNGHLHPQAV